MDTKNNIFFSNIPTEKELEKELSEFFTKKFGTKIKVLSPIVMPAEKADLAETYSDAPSTKSFEFDMLPEELECYLDGYVIKQHSAKATLATKVCTHFNRVVWSDRQKKKMGDIASPGMIKNNILIIGPTGVGKTYMVKLIARKLGVPFIKGDATKFSETGYVGADVEDLVRDLLQDANDDINMAENGIIYIDEIDKIATSSNVVGRDISCTGVQRALLKPMEETEVNIKIPHDPVSQLQALEQFRKSGKVERKVVNTKNILFIMSGAFSGLVEIIQKRLKKQGIGFEADISSNEILLGILRHVTAQDLVEFGLENEFVGRLPIIVIFDELTAEDLFEILKNPNNAILLSKRLDFKSYGIDLVFEDEALKKLAYEAAKEHTGARGIVGVVERILMPFEKHLPSTDVKQLVVTPNLVDNPVEHLTWVLENHNEKFYKDSFINALEIWIESVKDFLKRQNIRINNNEGLSVSSHSKFIGEISILHMCDINQALDLFSRFYKDALNAAVSFSCNSVLKLSFTEDAIGEIAYKAIITGENAAETFSQIAEKLEYGLNLVREHCGICEFEISREAIKDLEKFVSHLIKHHVQAAPLSNASPGTSEYRDL